MTHWSKTTLAIIGACGLAWASCGGKQGTSDTLANTAQDKGAKGAQDQLRDLSQGVITFSCDFDNGWVAVIPEAVMGEQQDEFLMQALIGFATEPEFWNTLEEYKKFEPHAAQKCGAEATTIALSPGNYVLMVGWAGQFEKTKYKNNGHIEKVLIVGGDEHKKKFAPKDLDADMPCISCPFLLVMRGGKFVELGQILIDRYIASRQGTDTRATVAEVEDGLVTIQLAEREPEVSYIDSIEVWHNGKPLVPAAAVPGTLHGADGSFHTLSMGDAVTMQFQAPIKQGMLDIEIRVNGYYLLDR